MSTLPAFEGVRHFCGVGSPSSSAWSPVLPAVPSVHQSELLAARRTPLSDRPRLTKAGSLARGGGRMSTFPAPRSRFTTARTSGVPKIAVTQEVTQE